MHLEKIKNNLLSLPVIESALRGSLLKVVYFALAVSCAAEIILGILPFKTVTVPLLTAAQSSGRIGLLFLLLASIYKLGIATLPPLHTSTLKDTSTLIFLIIFFLFIEFLGLEFSQSISLYLVKNYSLDGVTPESIHFIIPLAGGGLLVQAMLGIHFLVIYGVSLSILTSIYVSGGHLLSSYFLVTIIIAGISLAKVKNRTAYVISGLVISLISVLFIFFFRISLDAPFQIDFLVSIIAGIFGGILCILFASGFAPIIETIGGYVTDIRLLEIATIDHPLLKELSVQAPGTWNHSVVMGLMSEAAAEAIGANATLARVCCYFHDIGKLKKPLYFVENQLDGVNRHDKLSPSMSALIIRSHVKDGLELAKKYSLPQAIQDMIPQHHGTSLIEFFYEKAVKDGENVNSDGDFEKREIDKSLYRYPGPKPQTKEAGIIMLADGIEAASRTMSDSTTDRIQGMVQKMINKVFASGELNECNLTLQDLHFIARQFTRVLSGIYHQRIAYAEPAEKTNTKSQEGQKAGNETKKSESQSPDQPQQDSLNTPANSSTKRSQNSENPDSTSQENRKENLKRLGME
jgi:cyclic-di-AMP phosphodiesterase PgpH